MFEVVISDHYPECGLGGGKSTRITAEDPKFGMGWDWKSLGCYSEKGSASSSDIDGELAARLVSSAGSHQAHVGLRRMII